MIILMTQLIGSRSFLLPYMCYVRISARQANHLYHYIKEVMMSYVTHVFVRELFDKPDKFLRKLTDFSGTKWEPTHTRTRSKNQKCLVCNVKQCNTVRKEKGK